MTVAEYIVKILADYSVSDVFGIPGGVILPFLYAVKNSSVIQPHLLYNEQSAAFAALGYSQKKKKLACAYATRGPGIANMMTAIAEAYHESLPVVFITAHGKNNLPGMRMTYDQEIDFVPSVSKFTKYAAVIDSVEDVECVVEKAMQTALSERFGPVLLDFSAKLFSQEINQKYINLINAKSYQCSNAASCIMHLLQNSARPIFLIGDGIKKSEKRAVARDRLKRLGIPVISSRGAQDFMAECDNYFGYIGSHGIRYANFILAKADAVIVLGNRMSFPKDSKSFAPVLENKKIIRIDVDKTEFLKELPNVENFCTDAGAVVEALQTADDMKNDKKNWLFVCNHLKKALTDCDLSEPCCFLMQVLSVMKNHETTYVCDVGNNEFFFSRAYEKIHPKGEILYSKSFGTLGCALGRAIGAWHAENRPVVCIVGDQGFQYNIQELQYIVQWKIPLKIAVMNNNASGMIKDHEETMHKELFHVSEENGYSVPDFRKVTEAYGMNFVKFDGNFELLNGCLQDASPCVIEYKYSDEIKLEPFLPKGNKCENLFPPLEESFYNNLEIL